MLLVGEFFDREDERFVDELRKVSHAPSLAGFVDRWKVDARPWPRRQIFEYLRKPLNAPGHHVVVKRLFKQAEQRGDHELTAAFLAAFDRLIRRVRLRKRRYEWIPETRQSLVHETEYLATPKNAILPSVPRQVTNPFTGKTMELPPRRYYGDLDEARLFSYRTRRYLRRRVWRYFRRLGFQKPAEYVPAVTRGLLEYVDDDVRAAENLLDCRSLTQVCFGKHPALEFTPATTRLKAGRSLAELAAAPYFEPLWKQAEAVSSLLRLLTDAQSRPVRLWARQLLERHHAGALAKLPIESLFRLLDHDDAELQQFGATLLASMPGVGAWPVETWLRLIGVRDPTAQAIVCEQLLKHVAPARIDLGQALQLATANATPVARIGLQFLRSRKWDDPADRRALVGLGSARSAAVGRELAKWALGLVGTGERYERDVVVALFDSLLESIRGAACDWFAGAAAAQDDPLVWTRLMETPFHDVRLRIVELLDRRAARPRIDARDLAPLWTSVLLGVHRGGRHKLRAVEQLAAAMVDRPETAPQLLPVLGAAVRSVRPPEQRAGLAAVASLVERRPDLAGLVRQSLPELTLTPSGAG